jgi:hypothetical protein
MIFFPLGPAYGGIIRGFPAAAYITYASPQTLVRPCQTKKIRIYELDTQQCLKKIMAQFSAVQTISRDIFP